MIITPEKFYAYFRDNFVIKVTSQNWYKFDCPICDIMRNKQKCAIQFEWGMVKCWECGSRWRAIDFVMEYEQLSYAETKNKLYNYKASNIDIEILRYIVPERKSEVTLPYGFKSILEGEGMLGKRARAYLEGRGMNLEMLDMMGFGYVNDKDPEGVYEDYFGYIIIPFKRKGSLYYYIGRDFIDNYLRYKNPDIKAFGAGKDELLFNEDALEYEDHLGLTEGWACATTMGREYMAMLGITLSKKQAEKIIKVKPKSLTIIPDAKFYKEGVKIGSKFLDYMKVKVVDLTKTKEYQEDVRNNVPHIRKDPNDIGKEGVMEVVEETPYLTMKEVIKTIY